MCKALGYDLNTVEFAVEDGVPYAIDFMNPAPDADYHSVGAENFEWIVDKVARLAIAKAQEFTGEPMEGLRWSNFLTGDGVAKAAPVAVKKSAAKQVPAKAAAKKTAT